MRSSGTSSDVASEAIVEPIPETVEALQELTRLGDETVARTLLRISRAVESIVPEVVGVSVSVNGNLTFTMTATDGPVAALDGVQYLAGGPCEDTLRTGEPHSYRKGDDVDENRWQMFARATAAAGVGSTLSLPILASDGSVVAGINIYASTPNAFEGHHHELAAACGAWAGGAITNADLGFDTRFQAAQAPELLRLQTLVDRAVGALMAERSISAEEAREQLRTTAQRAGITDAQMARAILGLFTSASVEQSDDDRD
jgi:GAF domain-containing protein